MKQDQGFLKLRKIRAAQRIAKIMSNSSNRAYLPSDGLMLNIAGNAWWSDFIYFNILDEDYLHILDGDKKHRRM